LFLQKKFENTLVDAGFIVSTIKDYKEEEYHENEEEIMNVERKSENLQKNMKV